MSKPKKPSAFSKWSRRFLVLFLVVCMGLVLLRVFGPAHIERTRAKVRQAAPYEPSEKAAALHARIEVADLHADSLLWDRDLTKLGTRGHVDVPRLQAANVALQCFTVVTKSPRGQSISGNSAETLDNITLLTMVQGWPSKTWGSLLERALFQSRKLEDVAARSEGALRVLRWRGELAKLREDRKETKTLVGGVLGLEGAHCLEGKLENVDVVFEAGFRMLGLAHFFDNAVSGSAHGEARAGLTALGKQVVARCDELGIFIDLAHASPAAIDDTLAILKRPPLVSHTGVRGVADNERNLSDAHVKAIAAKGGLIGIGFWDVATGGEDEASIVRSIRYVADLVGVRHVGLGSDFDGSVTTPWDVRGLPLLTDALLADGFSEDDVALIMGGNQIRLFAEHLPEAKAAD